MNFHIVQAHKLLMAALKTGISYITVETRRFD